MIASSLPNMPIKRTIMLFDGRELATATRGRCINNGNAGNICTDTRKIQKGDWFLAIVGENFDGHKFCNKAKEMGISGVIGQHVPEDWDIGFVKVEDSIVALQNIARHIRKQYTGTVIAITGSAGKTTTRALIDAVLKQKGSVLATQGNFNNHIGLPLTILRSSLNEDFWVLELGMNHLGEIQLLQEISQPHIRAITNVGAAHLEGVGSLDGVAKAKGEIFDGARVGDLCIQNADDTRIMKLPIHEGVRTQTFGHDPNTDIQIVSTEIDVNTLHTNIAIQTSEGLLHSSLRSPGLHLASNVAIAVAVGLEAKCTLADIKKGVEEYEPVGARLRVEDGPCRTKILNDAYNANPLSMRASLNTLSQLEGHTRIALLGDMLELGDGEVEAHQKILAHAMSLPIEIIGVCGSIFSQAVNNMDLSSTPCSFFHADDASALGKIIRTHLKGEEILLLKGSRGSKMENLILELERA